MVTATALYLLSGFAEPLPAAVSAGAIGVVALLATVDALGLVTVPRLQAARQIPRSVFDRRPARAAAGFGFELGTGVRTYVTATAPYVAAAGLLLMAGPWSEAALVGVAFGTARGALPTSRALSPDPAAWDATNAAVSRWAAVPAVAVVTVAVLHGRGLL